MTSTDEKRLAEIEENLVKADMGGNMSDISTAIDNAYDLIAEVRRLKAINVEMLAALKIWLDFDNQEIKTAIAKAEKRS